jgi:hypothetical protein
MALLYGEGHKAFQRLQEEIIRTSSDHSLFAWGIYGSLGIESESPGLLARSVALFRDHVEVDPQIHLASVSSHYSMTNMGVQITLRFIKFGDDQWSGILVPLDCRAGKSKILALALSPTARGVWRRANWLRPTRISPERFIDCPVRTFYISGPSTRPIHHKCKLILEAPLALQDDRIVLRDVYPPYVHASAPFQISDRATPGDHWMFYLTELLPLKPSGRLSLVLQFIFSETRAFFYLRISCDVHKLPVLDNEELLLLQNVDTGILPGDPHDDEQSLADFVVSKQRISPAWKSQIDIANFGRNREEQIGALIPRVSTLEDGDEEGRFRGWEKVVLNIDLPRQRPAIHQ